MKTTLLSRRSFLGGMGAGVLASPFVPHLEAHGAAAGVCLAIFHTPNGVGQMARWRPTGAETAFQLGESLGPLEAWKQRLIVFDGIESTVHSSGPGGHSAAMPEILTGYPAKRNGGDKPGTRAQGPSIDQVVAKTITDTRYRSLELGVSVVPSKLDYGIADAAMVYAAAGQPILPVNEPQAIFDKLFGGGLGAMAPAMDAGDQAAAMAQVRADRKSVLDLVTGDLKRLMTKVGKVDRERLGAHLDSVERIEKGLEVVGPAGGSGGTCTPPAKPDGDTTIPAVTKLQIDLMVLAFQCGLTRVASLEFGGTNWNTPFTWVPGGAEGGTGQHMLSHQRKFNAAIKVNAWFSEQFAYLLSKLDAVKEGGMSLLDRTAILWSNEFGEGEDHHTKPLPIVLAGKAGGAWRTGRFIKLTPARSMNDVLTSVCHAVGLTDIAKFGDGRFGNGPIPGLG